MKIGRLVDIARRSRFDISLNEGADHEDRPAGSGEGESRPCAGLNEGADHEDRPAAEKMPAGGMSSPPQ